MSMSAAMAPEAPHDRLAGQPWSGFQGHLDYRIVEWEDGRAVIELVTGPHLTNRHGVVHGGVLVTLIDAACGFAGCFCTVPGNHRTGATLSVSTSFVAPAKTGTLRVVARRRGGGRRIFISSAEIFDEAGNLLALGECTYRYNRGSETPEGSPIED